MILTLLLLLCNHDDLIPELSTSEKNSCLNEGWLFIGSFKVGSVKGVINKEVLAQFVYKPGYWTEKLFIYENLKKLLLCVAILNKEGR